MEKPQSPRAAGPDPLAHARARASATDAQRGASPAASDAALKPVPAGSYYEVMGVPREASREEIREAWRAKVATHYPAVVGGKGSYETQAHIEEAVRVLLHEPARLAYDATLDPPPDTGAQAAAGARDGEGRFLIEVPRRDFSGTMADVEFSFGRGNTDDPRCAAHFRSMAGYKVIDRREGEPGGWNDPAAMRRFKIEIPPGRKFSGKSFTDSRDLGFCNGVAWTDNVDCLNYYGRELGYIVTDRGGWECKEPHLIRSVYGAGIARSESDKRRRRDL